MKDEEIQKRQLHMHEKGEELKHGECRLLKMEEESRLREREQGGRGWRGDGRRQKNHRPACGERVRGPKTQPHCRRFVYCLHIVKFLLMF